MPVQHYLQRIQNAKVHRMWSCIQKQLTQHNWQNRTDHTGLYTFLKAEQLFHLTLCLKCSAHGVRCWKKKQQGTKQQCKSDALSSFTFPTQAFSWFICWVLKQLKWLKCPTQIYFLLFKIYSVSSSTRNTFAFFNQILSFIHHLFHFSLKS